jgi:hypothetical protein
MPRDEPAAGEPDVLESIPNFTLLERVLKRANAQRANTIMVPVSVTPNVLVQVAIQSCRN